MDIERDAPVLETGEIVVEAPADITWETLADLQSWPEWFSGVRQIRIEGEVGLGAHFKWKVGGASLQSELVSFEPGRAIGWTGRFLGISAVHLWRIEPIGTSARVLSEESWKGFIPRAFTSRSRRTVRRATENGLATLKEEAERRAASIA
ncbi:MAG: SRPBCC family protein [Acidimicrobiia bacterium]